MTIRHQVRNLLLLFIFLAFSNQRAFSQCFQIESILVDACGVDEGYNEMVRFKVGPVSINTSLLSVNWPSNSWQNLIQDATTAAKVATLNADIAAAGGCGQLLEPVGGVLPANATVILVTSYLLDPALNSFGALTENVYIIFQNNNSSIGGHFANSGTGNRTLQMSFGSCSDSATYNRALLITQAGTPGAGDGATVLFTPAGVATYINNGCAAPVPPFTVDATPATTSGCPGATIALTATAQGQQSVLWSAPSGTFSTTTALSTNYTIAGTPGSTVTVTITATNLCGTTITDTVQVTVSAGTTPTFNAIGPICNGSAAPALPTTSTNGVTGTWSPAAIDNTTSGTYTFTPASGSCAAPVNINVNITPKTLPGFTDPIAICNGDTAPTLNTTSPNGVTGTWNPATISNTTSGTYVFTPNSGQCSEPQTITVNVASPTTSPGFANLAPLCSGDTAPVLNATSPTGITGTWNPAVVSNTNPGSYVFTPDPGQCATQQTLTTVINAPTSPGFANIAPICSGDTAPILNTASPTGITGTWNPAIVSNTTPGSYVFTPDAGQCATQQTIPVTITPKTVPNFTQLGPICFNGQVPALPLTSTNGITGTWNPATVSNTATTTYLFTPDTGECATTQSMTITVNNGSVPDFPTPLEYCQGAAIPPLPTTSPNGITGTWNPATINNNISTAYIFTPSGTGSCIQGQTITINIKIPDVTVLQTPAPICIGDAAPVLSNTSVNGITGTWNPATVDNNATGIYVFTPDAGQCATTEQITIVVKPLATPVFDLTDPITLCYGETAPILNTTSINGITGSWNPATIDNTANATYTFTPDAMQCAGPITIDVIVNTSTVDPITGDNRVCAESTIQLADTTVGGTWSSDNEAIATVDPTTGLVTGVGSGTVDIVYTTTGSCGVSTSKSIDVFDLPKPDLKDAYLCLDNQTNAILGPVSLDSMVPGTDYSFVWTYNGDPLPDTTRIIDAYLPGVYTVVATYDISGCSATSSCTVGTSSIAIADATVSRDFNERQEITVNVTGGSGVYEFQIDKGAIQQSNIFTNITQGEYQITVRDVNGCGSIDLYVYALNYPYFFTPNGDSFNDYWNIKGLEDQLTSKIYIFDRYGKLLKEIKPSDTGGWDGTFNGYPLPSTDYWFKLLYTDREGAEKEFKAHFALKR